jgi:hypothetical protein
MRQLFTDGLNSFWHVAFGIMAVWFWWITPLFVAYQLKNPYEKNVLIDLGEFAAGYMLGFATSKKPCQDRDGHLSIDRCSTCGTHRAVSTLGGIQPRCDS